MSFRIAVDKDISPQGVAITRVDRSADEGGVFDGDVTATARTSIYVVHGHGSQRGAHDPGIHRPAQHRYSVVTYDGEVETLRQVIDGSLARYPSEDRIVVYCYTIKEMKSYPDEIGGAVFYSGVEDIER